VLGLFAAGASAEEKANNSLKDGQLTQTLVIKDVQGGFAGFTGEQWTVEPSGAWKHYRVFNEKLELLKEGRLTKEQLAHLAAALAKYDLMTLKNLDEGKRMANPHVVTISYGKHEATLVLRAGAPLPKPDPKSLPGRYAGIIQEVQSLTKGKGGADK
jgi:hypothetical protein